MQPPLANDKKRVKVYELRDNDWFDRGTGFCTGQVINVSFLPICANLASFDQKRADMVILRMNRASMSSPRTNPTACCWKHVLLKTMVIRNNKVRPLLSDSNLGPYWD